MRRHKAALLTAALIFMCVLGWLALGRQTIALVWLATDIGWLAAALYLWNKPGTIDRPRLLRRFSRLFLFWS